MHYLYIHSSVFTPVATQGDITAAVVGGVLGTALILSLTVIVIVVVVVIVLLKNRGDSSSRMQRKYGHYVPIDSIIEHMRNT